MPQEVGRRKAKEVGAESGKHGKLLVKRLKRKQKRGTPRGRRRSSEVPRINGRALTLQQTTPIKLWVITSLIRSLT